MTVLEEIIEGRHGRSIEGGWRAYCVSYRKAHGIGAVIPTKADEAPDPAFDRVAYRERYVVERLINRLKQ